MRERRLAEARAEGGEILGGAIEMWVDGIGDPAGEGDAAGGQGLAGKKGVAETAQAQADDEQHRQLEGGGEVGHGGAVADGGVPAAGAFHHHAVGVAGQRVQAGAQQSQVDDDAGFAGGYVGRWGGGSSRG